MTKSLAVCCIVSFLVFVSCGTHVSMRETTMKVKTNDELYPNPVPEFSGMDGKEIYPYQLHTNIDYSLRERDMKALCIENEYIQVVVLPEFGGHIYKAIDKLTGKNMLWENNELKQALIGLTGAWCAFGLEFNFPKRGHMPTSLQPVNYTLQRLPDGGAAIVVSDREYIGDMIWTAKVILRPKSPRLEIAVNLYNPTDYTRPIYFWANTAVRANDNVQFVFPQPRSSTHGSPWIREWPVEEGKDLSWYKNHSDNFLSRFNRDDCENFMGYYDYKDKFGAFHVADRNMLPYRKFWSWGQTPAGKQWNKRLSETGGDYVELQAGLFQDQETMGFFPPHASLSFTEYWMPVRKCGGFQYGTMDGALSLVVDSTTDPLKHKITFGANTYQDFGPGTIELCMGDSVLRSQAVRLAPEQFHLFRFDCKKQERPYTVRLRTRLGREILAFTQGKYRQTQDWTPGEITYFKPDSTNLSSEEYWLKGRYQEVRYAFPAALEIYRKGLAVFPHSLVLNKAAANLCICLGRASEAFPYLKEAMLRKDFDPEVDYLFALAYLQTGAAGRADYYFSSAARLGFNQGSCLYNRGLIRLRQADWKNACPFFEQALAINKGDLLAATCAALCYSHMSNFENAQELAEQALDSNPAFYAAFSVFPEKHRYRTLYRATPRNELKQWLYLAGDLASFGEFDAAGALLDSAPGFRSDPLYWYYRAWIDSHINGSRVNELLANAAGLDVQACFPHTLLDREVSDFALSKAPESPCALHCAGMTRLAAGEFEQGAALLEKAIAINGHSAYSNLVLSLVYGALAYPPAKVADQLSAALQARPDMQYAALMLSREYTRQARPAPERLAMLLKTREAAGGQAIEALDEAIILAHIEMGQYAEAAKAMAQREFSTWEHGTGLRPVWWNCNLLWARSLMREGKYMEALGKIDTSLVFPKTIGANETNFGLEGYENNYLRGKILTLLKRGGEAQAAFKTAAEWSPVQRSANSSREPDTRYHRLFGALAALQAGQGQKAGAIFNDFKGAIAKDKQLNRLALVYYYHVTGERARAGQIAREYLADHEADITYILMKEYLAGNIFR